MQNIERVGAVALLFILVTILVVALWDDGGDTSLTAARSQGQARLDPAGGRQAPPRRTAPRTDAESTRRGERRGAPRKPTSKDAEGLRAVRAAGRREDRSLLGDASSVAPVAEVAPSALPAGTARSPQTDPVPLDVPTGGKEPGKRLLDQGWDNGRATRGKTAQVAQPASSGRKHKSTVVPATKTASNAAAESGSGLTHRVRSGETLGEIARMHLGKASLWPKIAHLNGLEGDRIREGQVLRLPVGSKPLAASTPASGNRTGGKTGQARLASTSSGQRTYVIRKGDVLSLIAQRELGSAKRWPEILSLNPGLDEKKLAVGATILLPLRSAGAAVERVALASSTRPRDSKRPYVH